MDSYRKSCERQHRVLGHFLAVQAWLRGIDCIVLSRKELEIFLGLAIFKSARIKWLREDLKPWFPHQKVYRKPRSSFSSLFLSRTSLLKAFPRGTMTTSKRIRNKETEPPKTQIFSTLQKGHRHLEEADIVRYLAALDSGLECPTSMSSVSINS